MNEEPALGKQHSNQAKPDPQPTDQNTLPLPFLHVIYCQNGLYTYLIVSNTAIFRDKDMRVGKDDRERKRVRVGIMLYLFLARFSSV